MRSLQLAAGMSLWAAVLVGATQLHRLDLPIGHGICGPWGCAAEPGALLGYHFFLAALLSPLAVLGVWAAAPERRRLYSLALLGAGVVGTVLLAGTAAIRWVSGGEPAAYAVQRGAFVVITTPDLPVLPLLLAGLVSFVCLREGRSAGWRSVRHDSPTPP